MDLSSTHKGLVYSKKLVIDRQALRKVPECMVDATKEEKAWDMLRMQAPHVL